MEILRLPFACSGDTAVIRHAAREALAGWQGTDLVDDALVVISELVQNVIQHAGGQGLLVLTRRGAAVLVEVSDADPAPPRIREPDPRRPGGRGLVIVKAVTQRWGTRYSDAGKVVWAELAVAHGSDAVAAPDQGSSATSL